MVSSVPVCIDIAMTTELIVAGKTVLASLVVDEARKISNAAVACFYCKHTDEQRHGALTIIKSLLAQLMPRSDFLLHYLYEEASTSGDAVLSSFEMATRLLEVAVQTFPRTYIVLDGLDEYAREDRKEIANLFQDIVSSIPKSQKGFLRCLFVSQEDGTARKDLSMIPRIKITRDDNKADIHAFCQEWHERIEKKFGDLKEEIHLVRNVVTARAQGRRSACLAQSLSDSIIKECFCTQNWSHGTCTSRLPEQILSVRYTQAGSQMV